MTDWQGDWWRRGPDRETLSAADIRARLGVDEADGRHKKGAPWR